ncbi:hypothetical protein [Tropicimonas sp. IMCC34011]|uniref:hypothetical protein n=1 Tax=Tropicimonas sp. IMCC34011 TaxID=2248759 RepID=UPI000E23CA92|nr:hypothetical protein [Tropicimonas sp. IMCC34011]
MTTRIVQEIRGLTNVLPSGVGTTVLTVSDNGEASAALAAKIAAQGAADDAAQAVTDAETARDDAVAAKNAAETAADSIGISPAPDNQITNDGNGLYVGLPPLSTADW